LFGNSTLAEVRQLIVVFTGLLMVVLIVGLVSLYRIAGSLDQTCAVGF